MVGFLLPFIGKAAAAIGGSAIAKGVGGALLGAAPEIIGGALSMRSASMARDQAVRDDALKFVRLRQAALAGGFNPLTALQHNFSAGLPSGAPPLASIELATGALSKMRDSLTGKEAASAQRAQLENDLLKAQIEATRATTRMGTTLGRGSNSVAPSMASVRGGLTAQTPKTDNLKSLAPGREVEVKPVESIPGIMGLNNAFTGGEEIVFPGSDGEPWDIWENIAVGAWSLPQMTYKGGKKAIQGLTELPGVIGATTEHRRTLNAQLYKDWEKREAQYDAENGIDDPRRVKIWRGSDAWKKRQ